MYFLKLFENFNRKYNNIDNIIDGEEIDYYQIPFSLGDGDGTCICDDDRWCVCLSDYYVYDYITDNDISTALKIDLSGIDVSKDWTYFSDTNSRSIYPTAYTNKDVHILRVAKLVKEMQAHEQIQPISMHFDVMSYNHDIKNNILDGNHRIRALQYLKYDYFPVYVSGSHAELLIDYIKNEV